jgi:hypothetical protein
VALKNLIVKNPSGLDQLVVDLGILIANGSYETYTTLFDIRKALLSYDLITKAKAGTLVLNNGSIDIPISEIDDFIQYFDTGQTGMSVDDILINASGEVITSKTGNVLITG